MCRLSWYLADSISWNPQGLFIRLQVMLCLFYFDVPDHTPWQDIASPLHVTKSTSYYTQHCVSDPIFRQLLTLRLHLLYNLHFTSFVLLFFFPGTYFPLVLMHYLVDIIQLMPHFILVVPPSIADRCSSSCKPFIRGLLTSFLQGKYYQSGKQRKK